MEDNNKRILGYEGMSDIITSFAIRIYNAECVEDYDTCARLKNEFVILIRLKLNMAELLFEDLNTEYLEREIISIFEWTIETLRGKFGGVQIEQDEF